MISDHYAMISSKSMSSGVWRHVLRFGPSVFRDDQFISWARRVNSFGEVDGLLNEEGDPLYPFFWELIAADEAQDFMEIDLVLFAKMSASIRSLFFCADPAQVRRNNSPVFYIGFWAN